MDNKGQDPLELMLIIGCAILVAAIVLALVADVSNIESNNNAANNFCEAWAEEKTFTHLRGHYLMQLSGRVVECEYSFDAEIFDGGISPGEKRYKYFEISEDDLRKWFKIEEPKSCCEECS